MVLALLGSFLKSELTVGPWVLRGLAMSAAFLILSAGWSVARLRLVDREFLISSEILALLI